MFKVGLTGGIGCGKSTVAELFADYAVPVIDADLVARELVAPGKPALLEIQKQFGLTVLNTDGSLNRSVLRTLIFNDSEQKIKLEKILHPLIYANINNQVAELSYPYCIIAIPLIFETRMNHFVDRILVVDCPVDMQIKRVKARDQQSETEITAIINSQVSREFRLSRADDLIDNSADQALLAQQVKKLHHFYLSLCKISL